MLVLAGCSTSEDSVTMERTPQAGTVEGMTWQVVEFKEGYKAVPTPPGGRAAFIRMENGKLTGYSGANDITGNYLFGGAELSFSSVAMTHREAPSEEMKFQEAGLRAALENTVLYRRANDTLILLDRQERIRATFKAARPSP